MSADRVWVTRQGWVRYGSPSSFETLGKVWRSGSFWEAQVWNAKYDVVSTIGVFGTRQQAVSKLVEEARL